MTVEHVLAREPIWTDAMTIKHATASTFVFAVVDGEWRLGMVLQPRLRKRMVPGGHVEEDETVPEAALRETLEETGRAVRLLEAPAAPLPAGYPHPRVPQSWWTSELRVPRDNHLNVDHVHVDHVFVAVADSIDPVAEPVHEFDWYSEAQVLGSDEVFEDTKILAKELFAQIASLAAVG